MYGPIRDPTASPRALRAPSGSDRPPADCQRHRRTPQNRRLPSLGGPQLRLAQPRLLVLSPHASQLQRACLGKVLLTQQKTWPVNERVAALSALVIAACMISFCLWSPKEISTHNFMVNVVRLQKPSKAILSTLYLFNGRIWACVASMFEACLE